MTHPTDPRPILRAAIGCLEAAVSHQEWKCDFLGDGDDAKPPQWVLDTRRTLNEAKAFLSMMNGMYAAPISTEKEDL